MCGLFKCLRCRAVTEGQPNSVSSLYLTLQSVYLSGQLHGVSAEVVHGDGVVPVTEVVLLTWRLFLPPHAAHSQQHSYSGQRKRTRLSTETGIAAASKSLWNHPHLLLSKSLSCFRTTCCSWKSILQILSCQSFGENIREGFQEPESKSTSFSVGWSAQNYILPWVE